MIYLSRSLFQAGWRRKDLEGKKIGTYLGDAAASDGRARSCLHGLAIISRRHRGTASPTNTSSENSPEATPNPRKDSKKIGPCHV